MQYLEECLLALAEEPAEIIVVDNGSSDGSRELLRESFPQVRCIALERNEGFCRAVNIGIRESKTAYVILLNNDTRTEKGFVRALEAAMERDDRIFSGSAQMRKLHQPEKMDDAGDLYCALGWAFARGKDKDIERYQKSCDIFASCGGASIFRRELLDIVGTLDENHFAYLEDIDLGYRARIFGYRNVYVPQAVVYHAGSASSGSRYNKFKVDLTSKNSVYLIYKNMPLLQILLNLPFLLAGFLIKTLFFCKKGLGMCYLRGLVSGLQLSASAEGRRHKVRFSRKYLPHYVRIQWELWCNLLCRLRN